MSSIKQLKLRIKSVKSTQKITKAMKMVAAAKLRRAKESLDATVSHYQHIMGLMNATLQAVEQSGGGHPLLAAPSSDAPHVVVVISSDRGLCGSFNNSIAKSVRQWAQASGRNGPVELWTVGRKAHTLLYRSFTITQTYHDVMKRTGDPYALDAISDALATLVAQGKVQSCWVAYSHFVNAIQSTPTVERIFPLPEPATSMPPVMAYEPSPQTVLTALFSHYCRYSLHHAMLHSSTSEQASRMTAMDNATRNAGDMIRDLTVVMNRTRQATITTELTEIISGAEALQ